MSHAVTTPMTMDAILEGLRILAGKGHDFASSLLAGYDRYKKFTPRQMPWAEKLAYEAVHPTAQKPTDVLEGALNVIAEKFRTARDNGLKHPALLFFNIGMLEKIRLSLAPDDGNNPGFLYIKGDDLYMGKISPAGELFASKFMSKELNDFLHAFAADPVGVGAANGKAAGRCCYCGKELTDARSLTSGYGAHCAKKWNLPWGANAPLLKA